MRIILTVICCAVVAIVGGPAFATNFTWTGATDNNWNDSGNWNPSGFPQSPGDTARIDVATNNPVNFGSGTNSIDSITINADTTPATVGLSVTGGSLTTTGRTTIKGHQSGSNTATLSVSGGVFAPQYLEFFGRNDATAGHAIGDFDVDVTVGSTTNSTKATGYVDIDVSSTKTLTCKVLLVGDGLSAAYLKTGSSGGTGTVSSTGVLVEVGDAASESSALEHASGALSSSGPLRLNSSSSVAATTLVKVAAGATLSVDTFDLNGGDSISKVATLDFDESVTVSNSSNSTAFDGFVAVDLASGKTFTSKATLVGDGTQPAVAKNGASGGTGTFSATTLTIKGGDSAGDAASFEHASGTLTSSGLTKLQEGTYSTDHSDDATLTIDAGTTTTLNSFEMNGTCTLEANANVEVTGDFTVQPGALPTVDLAHTSAVQLKVGRLYLKGPTSGVTPLTFAPVFGSPPSSIVTD